MSESTPLVGLAVAVAWISLITVEFYEKIYRKRIEDHSEILKEMGQEKRNKLAADYAAQIVKGRVPKEAEVQSIQNDVDSLVDAEKVLTRMRERTFIILLVGSAICLVSSYAPSYAPAGGMLTLLDISYAALFILFLMGFLFLRKMFWFDKQIRITKTYEKQLSQDAFITDKPRSITAAGYRKIETMPENGVVAYYFPDYPHQKIIVDWSRKVAYYFDPRIDKAVKEGRVKALAIPGKTQTEFTSERGLALTIHPPTEKELPL